jgi:hypothetical protein
VSSQAPEKRDYLIVRITLPPTEDEETTVIAKEYVQVRYLKMILTKAHQLFKDIHPNTQVGIASFCNLRPREVKILDDMSHCICHCLYHENIRLLLIVLTHFTDVNKDTSDFIKQVDCNHDSRLCMISQCATCQNSSIDCEPTEPLKEVNYLQWKNLTGRAAKVEKKASLSEVFREHKNQLPAFLIHSYIKRKQAAFLDSMRTSVINDKTKAVVQVDFSQNYALVHQDEIQSAFWSHDQVTVLPLTAGAPLTTKEL